MTRYTINREVIVTENPLDSLGRKLKVCSSVEEDRNGEFVKYVDAHQAIAEAEFDAIERTKAEMDPMRRIEALEKRVKELMPDLN